MVRLKRIDHVAVCVANIDEAAGPWRALLAGLTGLTGLTGPTGALGQEHREMVASQWTDALLLPAGSGACLELIAPIVAKGAKGAKANDGLERFLAKRGPGLHHVAFEVEGIEEAIATLKGSGAPMIDETPRVGARGHKVAFVHPKAFGGVLVELLER